MMSDNPILQLRVGLKVNLPSLPTFIRAPDGTCFDIGAFDETQLTEIGAKWTEALIAKAAKRMS